MPESILPVIHSTTKLFLSGPFGCGKSTLALGRIRWLLRRERTRGDEILLLTPQRTLGRFYFDALYGGGDAPRGAPITITTVAGLARKAVELYWPLVGPAANFDSGREPTFLNLETSQFHMARFIDDALSDGEFDGIRVERNRVISQVLDNLNKAALQGFTIEEAYERLELAVPPSGDQRIARLNALRAARQISQQFRKHCLAQSLVDFSLQIELFNKHVLTNDWSRTHLFRTHKHMVFDNLEEDTATAHNLVNLWLPKLESALLVTDEQAGFRVFLGADPQGGYALANACAQQIRLDHSYLISPDISEFDRRVQQEVDPRNINRVLPVSDTSDKSDTTDEADSGEIQNPLVVPPVSFRFYPQMIAWVADEIRRLVRDQGVPAGEIAVLAPFVSDALRFSLQTALNQYDIPSTTHRPSRELQAEPAARSLLTLAMLAHPDWGLRPTSSDLVQALLITINALDPIRAHLLTRIVYPEKRRTIEMGRFSDLDREAQSRITYVVGNAYDRLREWIYGYRASAELLPLDQFFAKLFGELLSQPDYGFHENYDAARIANQLVDSARNFRWALENSEWRASKINTTLPASNSLPPASALAREYVHLIQTGALGALFAPGWTERTDAVFLSPAYTYLIRNRPVQVQFWLDVGASGWWERLYQPLTHPYVLSRQWAAGQVWTDMDEHRSRQQTIRNLLLGLIRRTKRQVYVGISEYSESGTEQRGALLMLLNRLLTRYRE